MKVENNTILITGGSSGIGLEMAKQFLNQENTVIITGRNKAKLERVQAQFPKIHTYVCDVSHLESIKDLYEKINVKFPQLNMLINNAGVMKGINLLKDHDDFSEEIDINLKGPIHMIEYFLPLLLKQEKAAIVNVSSGLAFINYAEVPIYCASKAALHTYTKILREQLKSTSVKVFELAPPKTDTPLFSSSNKMPTLSVSELVKSLMRGLKRNQVEILPGLSRILKFVGRMTL